MMQTYPVKYVQGMILNGYSLLGSLMMIGSTAGFVSVLSSDLPIVAKYCLCVSLIFPWVKGFGILDATGFGKSTYEAYLYAKEIIEEGAEIRSIGRTWDISEGMQRYFRKYSDYCMQVGRRMAAREVDDGLVRAIEKCYPEVYPGKIVFDGIWPRIYKKTLYRDD